MSNPPQEVEDAQGGCGWRGPCRAYDVHVHVGEGSVSVQGQNGGNRGMDWGVHLEGLARNVGVTQNVEKEMSLCGHTNLSFTDIRLPRTPEQ